MKKSITKVIIFILFCLTGQSVFAGYSDIKGEDICYIFKNNKNVSTSKCSYSGEGSGNIDGGYVGLTYKIPKYGKIEYLTSNQAKRRNNTSEPILDRKGNPIYVEDNQINSIKAKMIYRNPKTFKIVGKHTGKPLQCLQANDRSIELCTVKKP